MDFIFYILPILCLIASLPLLILLIIIDLRAFLLPDRYVFPLGVLGVLFHATLGFSLLPAPDMLIGAIVGGGFLWLVRFFGTKYYGQEAMGLGDVKLLIAGGAWLGPTHVITAIVMGAVAGLIHGILFAAWQWATKQGPFNLRRLVIPAGPGFIVGLVVTFIYTSGPLLLPLYIGIIG